MASPISIRFVTVATLSLIFAMPARAQLDQGNSKVFLFGSTGIGLGAGDGFNAGLHLIAGTHHEFTMGYKGFSRRTRALAPGAPRESHYASITLFDYPQETLSMFSLGYGYVLYSKRRPDVWRYVIRASGMAGRRRDVYNLSYNNYILSSAYSYDVENYAALGLLFEPCVQFTPTRGFGLSAGVYGMINDHFSAAGVNIGVMFGKVGNHKYRRMPATERGKARHDFRRKHPFRFYPKNLR